APAVAALAPLGDKAAAPGILGGARAATVDVVTTYADALIKLKPQGAAPIARQWLASPHAHIRHEGARVLTVLEGTPARAPAPPAKAQAPPAPPPAPRHPSPRAH